MTEDAPPLRAEITPLTTAAPGPGPGDLGIVMGGGGARAAYQVGFLRAVARRYPNLGNPA